ncbi:hypothetical protein OBBRIDRAFT_246645 [Obba rivulosa]|uniref:Uncharacterized protein n=1 Tax=Obba rivulosa TaxID=1052685 RepID=A0A8E2DHX8_9APHY|nr:hypothetical protein OBBRIDRAFT_246645 [Obba rivulosa]
MSLLRYAHQEVENNSAGQLSLMSCAVALLVCANIPGERYQEDYLKKVWELINQVFLTARAGHLYWDPDWPCFLSHISFLLLKHKHRHLRDHLGNGVIWYLETKRKGSHRKTLHDILKPYIDDGPLWFVRHRYHRTHIQCRYSHNRSLA